MSSLARPRGPLQSLRTLGAVAALSALAVGLEPVRVQGDPLDEILAEFASDTAELIEEAQQKVDQQQEQLLGCFDELEDCLASTDHLQRLFNCAHALERCGARNIRDRTHIQRGFVRDFSQLLRRAATNASQAGVEEAFVDDPITLEQLVLATEFSASIMDFDFLAAFSTTGEGGFLGESSASEIFEAFVEEFNLLVDQIELELFVQTALRAKCQKDYFVCVQLANSAEELLICQYSRDVCLESVDETTAAILRGLFADMRELFVEALQTADEEDVLDEFLGLLADFFLGDDPGLGTRYCSPAVPNSTGSPGQMEVEGSTVVADDDLVLMATSLPTNSNIGYFIMGNGMNTFIPVGATGPMCIQPGLKRYLSPVNNTDDLPGGFTRIVGTSGPVSGNITAGSTWNFQAWHRDSDAGTSNLTDAVSVTFQ